jgi:hypothetical protein
LDEEILPEKERDSTHEREEVLIPNPEEVERQRQRLEYVSAISSREWLRETEVMDQVMHLYPKAKVTLVPSVDVKSASHAKHTAS